MKKLKRTLLAFLLAICMAFGVVAGPVGMLSAAAKTSEPLNYVSLGDSMTNGYGLDSPNFKHNGYLDEISTAYPSIIKGCLQESTGREVNLTQLAVNSMRSEELYYLLSYDTVNMKPGNWEPDQYANDWDVIGDCTKIDPISGVGKTRAQIYQEAVKNADYITVSIGANSFSQFWTQQLMRVLGLLTDNTLGDKNGGYDYDLGAQLFGENKDIIKLAETTYSAIKGALLGILSSAGVELGVYEEVIERLAGSFIYGYVGFVKYYKAALEEIVKLNKNKGTIVLMGLINFFKDLSLSFGGNVYNLGDVVDILINNTNSYIRKVSTEMNLKRTLTFKKTYDFRYAEWTKPVKTIVRTFGDGLSDEMRAEFIEGVTDLIFSFLSSASDAVVVVEDKDLTEAKILEVVGGGKFPLVEIDDDNAMKYYNAYKTYLSDGKVAAEDALPGEEHKLPYLAVTMSIYEAFEKKIIAASGMTVLSIEALGALFGGGDAIASAFGPEVFADVLANKVPAALGEYMRGNIYDFTTNVTDVLYSQALTSEALPGLFYLYSSMLISNGMGCHPSAAGHVDYANVIWYAIDKNYRPINATIDKAVNGVVSTVKSVVSGVKNTIGSIFGK